METIIICLLVVAVALLVYVIVQGKKGDSVLQKEKPMGGLPNIIGRTKDACSYSSSSTTAQSERESNLSTTDNFDNRNAENYQIFELPQEGSEVAKKTLSDWNEEEEEMARYAASGAEDGFATGVTFDELATVGKILARQALEPSEEKTAAGIASKIDGTELLRLLESKVGDVSGRIAMLLDMELTTRSGLGSSSMQNDGEESFNIHDYT